MIKRFKSLQLTNFFGLLPHLNFLNFMDLEYTTYINIKNSIEDYIFIIAQFSIK